MKHLTKHIITLVCLILITTIVYFSFDSNSDSAVSEVLDSNQLTDYTFDDANNDFLLDSIVARYGDKSIYYYELEKYRLEFLGTAPITESNLLWLVLTDKLIEEETAGIDLTKKQIDLYLEYESEISGMDINELISSLNYSNSSEIINQSAKEHYYMQSQLDSLTLDDSTIREYYDNFFLVDDEIYFWQLIGTKEQMTAAYNFIKNGTDWRNVFELYPNEYTYTGFNGKITKSSFDQRIVDQLDKIAKGEVSKPFETDIGWMIIKYSDELDFQIFKHEFINDINLREREDQIINIRNNLIDKYNVEFPTLLNVSEFK